MLTLTFRCGGSAVDQVGSDGGGQPVHRGCQIRCEHSSAATYYIGSSVPYQGRRPVWASKLSGRDEWRAARPLKLPERSGCPAGPWAKVRPGQLTTMKGVDTFRAIRALESLHVLLS